ncbi:MAG: cell wall metabolism sensor histidine kinase WalK [Candidatus Nealsonbacteria bacterium]|nr:cell wall metabolism sensor histidine kinase WalK [Candidatus Nealsonbacteria bacterium]
MEKNSNKKTIIKEKELAEIDRVAKMLIRRDLELSETREKREKELEELKKLRSDLEESKSILEIKVKARTRQLKEFAEGLEEQVKERTKGLMKSREALLNMLEDVNEEKNLAEEEKSKTLAIFENFTDGLLFFNADDVLVLVNPLAEKLLKVESKKVIGETTSELLEHANLKPLIKILGEKIKKITRKELEINEELILEISTLPIIREKEKIGTLIILHDVTREKFVEKMKTEFVSLAAHQLRTPLSAIKWTLKMFLEGDLGKTTKEQKEFLEDAYSSNEKMITLVNDLLNVTRIEEGRYLYKLIPTAIEELVESIIGSYVDEIKKKKLKFKFKKPLKKLPKIMVDVEKMKIAIDNIINNAITYTLTGGDVMVSLGVGKKEIEFSAKDTGIGIPEKQQERIFTKFFRGANVIRMETEGTGLGLFIAKNIIGAHGGRIWFESEEGKGTTLYLTIPIREESLT